MYSMCLQRKYSEFQLEKNLHSSPKNAKAADNVNPYLLILFISFYLIKNLQIAIMFVFNEKEADKFLASFSSTINFC